MKTKSWIGGVAERVIRARRRRQTERTIERLPAHIRRDIGWPARRSEDRAC